MTRRVYLVLGSAFGLAVVAALAWFAYPAQPAAARPLPVVRAEAAAWHDTIRGELPPGQQAAWEQVAERHPVLLLRLLAQERKAAADD